MRIGEKYPKYNYTMIAEDGTIVQLEETVMEKDLGVVVDNKLTSNHHINSIVARANQVVPTSGYDTTQLQVHGQRHLCTIVYIESTTSLRVQ